jgi:hypothetical protein
MDCRGKELDLHVTSCLVTSAPLFLLLLFQQVHREYLELDIGCYSVCICHVVLGKLYDDYVNQIACEAVRQGTVLTSRLLLHYQTFDRLLLDIPSEV